MHLDQYSGKPLLDVGVKDYGGLAQAIEWGINVHQGQEFGRLNHPAARPFTLDLAGRSLPAQGWYEQLAPDPQAFAADLYAALHRLDDAGVASIAALTPPPDLDWHAITDRLQRAAFR